MFWVLDNNMKGLRTCKTWTVAAIWAKQTQMQMLVPPLSPSLWPCMLLPRLVKVINLFLAVYWCHDGSSCWARSSSCTAWARHWLLLLPPHSTSSLTAFQAHPPSIHLPHLVCVIATDGALQASGCLDAASWCLTASWLPGTPHSPTTLVSNPISEILLCPLYLLVAFRWPVFSFVPTAALSLQSPMACCRSHWCLLPWSSPWSQFSGGFISSAPFIAASLQVCPCLVLPLPTYSPSASPGVLIFSLTCLLLNCCLVPRRAAAGAVFSSRHLSCLCSSCSWLFAVIAVFHLLGGTQGKMSCAQIPLIVKYWNFTALHCNLLSENSMSGFEKVPHAPWSQFLLECPSLSQLFFLERELPICYYHIVHVFKIEWVHSGHFLELFFLDWSLDACTLRSEHPILASELLPGLMACPSPVTVCWDHSFGCCPWLQMASY